MKDGQVAADVVIVGGGPAGSTAATMLRKYARELSVLVIEREAFPRDHVGESLLPIVSSVLNQMGCWDKIEAAGFPVKVGATYRWGSSNDLWDFDFLAGDAYEDSPRPATYGGQRVKTAFQVDRAIYDQILLDHAKAEGAEVREQVAVREVLRDGDRILGLELASGETVTGRHYLDCSGSSAILRRSLGVGILEPSALRNIAVWGYWQNAEWAVNIGVSGTRIQVMSLGWGWIWFIPLGPTRTSVGLVVPAEFYKTSGRRIEELYKEAVAAEPRIAALLRNATPEEGLHTTKDWSFVSERICGPNWFLVGEAAGFADPILSAGLTVTQVGALEAAATIAEIERGVHDSSWLRSEYERLQQRRIRTHIQFADFWYSANAHFTELVEYTSQIARDAGIVLDGKSAWQWLGSGGFVDSDMGGAGVGGFSLVSASWLINDFTNCLPQWAVGRNNIFTLNLAGAEPDWMAVYANGRVDRIPALSREGRRIPTGEIHGFLLDTVSKHSSIEAIVKQIEQVWCKRPGARPVALLRAVQVLEALVNDGWITAAFDESRPLIKVDPLFLNMSQFHSNTDNRCRQTL